MLPRVSSRFSSHRAFALLSGSGALRLRTVFTGLAGGALLAAASCSKGNGTSPASASSASAGGSPTGSATTTASTASSSSGMGGAGGMGAGGAGGGGCNPPAVSCLDPSTYASVLSLGDAALCVTAIYTAPFVVGFDANFNEIAPTWGRHHGPLILQQAPNNGTSFTVTRYKAPGGTTGPLAVDSMVGPVDAMIDPKIAPMMLFLNAAAVDLPFNSWTAVGWSDFGSGNGELILLNGNAIDARFAAPEVFQDAGIAGASENRILTAGYGNVGGTNTQMGGLYATDMCAKAPCNNGGIQVHIEGDASGPVTVDNAGNAFAVYPTLASKKQTLWGYGAASIAPGQSASMGTQLAQLDGSGIGLAASAPTCAADGYLLFQPNVSMVNKNPVSLHFTAENGQITAKGTPADAIITKNANTEVRLMTDGKGHVWAGIATDPNKPESTFYVLDRAPAK